MEVHCDDISFNLPHFSDFDSGKQRIEAISSNTETLDGIFPSNVIRYKLLITLCYIGDSGPTGNETLRCQAKEDCEI